MNALLSSLKEHEQDFEWYPTTNEIISAMLADISSLQENSFTGYGNSPALESFLDIGAGNGKVIRAVREARRPRYEGATEMVRVMSEFYAIEKSPILCDQLDPDIFIVGTEFHEQSLLSKAVDVTFCNPPYREFNEWAAKIVRESASHLVYLVIPLRWKESLEISSALQFREAEATIIGDFSFLSSEDRQARAHVHLIRVMFPRAYDAPDAFSRFFDEQFADLKAKFENTKTKEERGTSKVDHNNRAKFSSLVVGPSYPERMVELYNAELDHIRRNYDMVSKLDADLLKEFDVTPDRILGCLRARLEGLRNVYWHELISNIKQVTDRLCSKKRQALLDKLNKSGHVDFTVSNIHAIVIWVLKNANQYLEEQLCETFESMIGKANVRNYASNTRVLTYDRWRYNEEKPTHIALEYRLVLSSCGGVHRSWSGKAELTNTAYDFIGDLLTVARNLGFECNNRNELRSDWAIGEKRVFTMPKTYAIGERVLWTESSRKKIEDKVQLETGCFQYKIDGEWYHENVIPGEPILEVRAFLNSNLHVRLNQRLALALNVEYGRLKGWLRDGQDAVRELGDEEAAKYFAKHLRLGNSSLPMLATSAAA